MKKLFGFILFIFLMTTANCYAAKFNFLVIPNDLLLDSKNDIIFQKSASLIGADIINYYNQHPDMSAVPINRLKTYLERPENYRLKKEVQKLITDYQNNYVVNYATVQKLASKFGTKQVLMINCNMDAQGYITRRTLWDALNIPGATVIDPAYRLSTQIALIDVNNQTTLWQHNYQKLISSRESRMLTATMGDTSEQLEKVQKYSTKFLSPQVVQETQLALLNMSPYQNLNLHPEVVKPNYVSIDKIKVDSKRGGVKSKAKLSGLKNNISNKVEQKKVLKERENALSTDEKIKQIQKYEQAKFELQKEKQKLKYEKQKQKAQLKEARRQAKMRAKLQLQEEKQKLIMQDAEFVAVPKQNVQVKNEKQKPEIEQVKNAVEVKKQDTEKVQIKKQAKEQPQKTSRKEKSKEKEVNNVETEVIPSSKIMQQDYKPVPYIRTKPILRERDYTINDY